MTYLQSDFENLYDGFELLFVHPGSQALLALVEGPADAEDDVEGGLDGMAALVFCARSSKVSWKNIRRLESNAYYLFNMDESFGRLPGDRIHFKVAADEELTSHISSGRMETGSYRDYVQSRQHRSRASPSCLQTIDPTTRTLATPTLENSLS